MTTLETPPDLTPILEDFIRVYKRDSDLHPEQFSSLFEMCAVLSEETGEVSNAVLNYAHGIGGKEQIKQEIIDTAAVCIRALEYLKTV